MPHTTHHTCWVSDATATPLKLKCSGSSGMLRATGSGSVDRQQAHACCRPALVLHARAHRLVGQPPFPTSNNCRATATGGLACQLQNGFTCCIHGYPCGNAPLVQSAYSCIHGGVWPFGRHSLWDP